MLKNVGSDKGRFFKSLATNKWWGDGRCQGESPKGWEGQQLFKEDDDALRWGNFKPSPKWKW